MNGCMSVLHGEGGKGWMGACMSVLREGKGG